MKMAGEIPATITELAHKLEQRMKYAARAGVVKKSVGWRYIKIKLSEWASGPSNSSISPTHLATHFFAYSHMRPVVVPSEAGARCAPAAQEAPMPTDDGFNFRTNTSSTGSLVSKKLSRCSVCCWLLEAESP